MKTIIKIFVILCIFRDDYTDENDAQSKQCLQDLRATHWTQETGELRNKWKQTPGDMEEIQKNVQIIK